MSDLLDRLNANDSHSKLPELTEHAWRINQNLQQSLDAARGYTDPDLSPEGLGKKREELAAQARKQATSQLEELRRERTRHADRIRAWAEGKRPRIADDPVQLQKAALAWDRARALLDSGRTIGQVLSTATDPAMVLAIREWAPDYLRASTPRQEGLQGLREEPDYSALVRSADDRLAELHGGEVANAIRMLHDLDVAEVGMETRGKHVGQQLAGAPHDPLQAALETHYAEQHTAAGYQDTAPQGDAA